MSGSMFSLFDMAICVVPAMSFGIWQLVSVNREIARDKAKKALLPDDARHPVGEHGLHDR
jgi:hypothetical protein